MALPLDHRSVLALLSAAVASTVACAALGADLNDRAVDLFKRHQRTFQRKGIHLPQSIPWWFGKTIGLDLGVVVIVASSIRVVCHHPTPCEQELAVMAAVDVASVLLLMVVLLWCYGLAKMRNRLQVEYGSPFEPRH